MTVNEYDHEGTLREMSISSEFKLLKFEGITRHGGKVTGSIGADPRDFLEQCRELGWTTLVLKDVHGNVLYQIDTQ